MGQKSKPPPSRGKKRKTPTQLLRAAQMRRNGVDTSAARTATPAGPPPAGGRVAPSTTTPALPLTAGRGGQTPSAAAPAAALAAPSTVTPTGPPPAGGRVAPSTTTPALPLTAGRGGQTPSAAAPAAALAAPSTVTPTGPPPAGGRVAPSTTTPALPLTAGRGGQTPSAAAPAAALAAPSTVTPTGPPPAGGRVAPSTTTPALPLTASRGGQTPSAAAPAAALAAPSTTTPATHSAAVPSDEAENATTPGVPGVTRPFRRSSAKCLFSLLSANMSRGFDPAVTSTPCSSTDCEPAPLPLASPSDAGSASVTPSLSYESPSASTPTVRTAISEAATEKATPSNAPSEASTSQNSQEDQPWTRTELWQSVVNAGLQWNGLFDVEHLLFEMGRLDKHNESKGCRVSDLKVLRVKTHGLKTCIQFHCSRCKKRLRSWSSQEQDGKMDINCAATAASILTGGGYSQLAEMCGVLNMPCMNKKTFASFEDRLMDAWEKVSVATMREAIEEEIKYARKHGLVSPDGVPLLVVTCDGSWLKRSSKRNYSSLSGMAAIVGVHTGKVLWFGWRNKYCGKCKWAESKGKEPPPHRCFLNWSGSANAMESDIIAEGFRCSEEMYGVRYKWFVGDGDSNVYKKIFMESPYENCEVEKIECCNHLLRNFCYHLEEVVNAGDNKRGLTRGKTMGLRKNLDRKIMKMRNSIVKACEHWRDEDSPILQKILRLKADILNCPKHVFGDHTNCARYFCDGKQKDGEINLVPILTQNNLWAEIMAIFNRLAEHSRSLIHLMNNNQVENLNTIICKLVGGKRINFVQRGSYVLRLMIAAVSKNTNQRHYRALHKEMCNGKSPGKFSKQHESKVVKSRTKDRARLSLRPRRRGGAKRDADYGNAVQRVNRTVEDIITELFEESLRWEEIERDTRVQGTPYWHRLRKFRLTGSNFGKVCKRKESTQCAALVRQLLYDSFVGNEHTEWGHKSEKKAIADYSRDEGVGVLPAGLFIDRDKPYLAASPDGVIEDGQGLVEVKCPSIHRNKKPIDAIRAKADVAFKIGKTGQPEFNKDHDHYYQMQGQMHITKKSYCIYIVWTLAGYIFEKIDYDDNFWKTKMEQQLSNFYEECLMVEIVEQNYLLGQPIKEPPRIVTARQNMPPPKRKNPPPSQNAKKQKPVTLS